MHPVKFLSRGRAGDYCGRLASCFLMWSALLNRGRSGYKNETIVLSLMSILGQVSHEPFQKITEVS